MLDDLTDITLVLDRSGSMSAIKNAMEEALAKLLEEQKAAPGRAHLTVYQFDDVFECVVQGIDLRMADPIRIHPRNRTALIDAIGCAINLTGARIERCNEQFRPGKVVFVIISDGLENASKEYTRGAVYDAVCHQREKYSWQFVFLGANQDACLSGQQLGIPMASAMTFGANDEDLKAAVAATSANLRSYRHTGSGQSLQYSVETRDKAVANVPKWEDDKDAAR